MPMTEPVTFVRPLYFGVLYGLDIFGEMRKQLSLSGEVYGLGTSKFGFAIDTCKDSVIGPFISLDDDRDVFFEHEALHLRGHASDANIASAVDHFVIFSDRDED